MSDNHQSESRLTDEQVNQIGTRADKATPGPWVAARNNIGVIEVGNLDLAKLVSKFPAGGILDLEDAEFTATARQDVPSLVAEVKTLRAELVLAQYAVAYERGVIRGMVEQLDREREADKRGNDHE